MGFGMLWGLGCFGSAVSTFSLLPAHSSSPQEVMRVARMMLPCFKSRTHQPRRKMQLNYVYKNQNNLILGIPFRPPVSKSCRSVTV